jgi:ParB family chromosome partitioning protein
MGQSDKADDIFKLLQRFAGATGGLAQRAIRGLRWFDTPGGWQLVRERATEEGFFWQDTAVEMLGFNDDPATRDLLLKLIQDDTFEHTDEALRSARRLFGPESLEPDYALLARGDVDLAGEWQIVERVCERGEPGRILELIPKCEYETTRQALATSLMRRKDVPIDAAAAQLESRNETAVETAAHLLGRAGESAAKYAPAVTAALQRWRARWHEERQRPQPRWGEHPVSHVTPTLKRLAWAAGRLGTATDELVALSAERVGDAHFAPVRLEAVRALAAMQPTDAVLDALAEAAVGPDPETRHAAAQALAERGPQRAAALAGQLLSDRASLQRLTRAEGIDLKAALETAAAQVHYQGVALPELIAAADLGGLQQIAQNRELPETTRLGAIEAIGRLGSEPAETALSAIGADEKEDEPIRKEAWRSRRRSIRLRTKAAV